MFSGGRLLPVQWTDDAVYVMDWPPGASLVKVYTLSLADGRLQTVAGRLAEAEPIHAGGVWLTDLQVLGFATDGSPLLLANSAAGSRLVRVSAPGQAAETYPVQVFPTSVTDGGGTWLMQPDGTVLHFLPGAPPGRAGKGDPGLKPAAGCAG